MFDNWNIMVVGAGAMGSGIAQVFAVNGFKTTLVDQNTELLDRAGKIISDNVENLIREGLASSQDAERIEACLNFEIVDNLENCAPKANLVVESIYENAEAKRDIFAKLDSFCTPDCILCSNTSGLNVFDIAQVSNPQRFLVTHWFNPPFIMRLVEIVMGPETSEETVEKVKSLYIQMGKEPAVIKQYIPGFIVNRLAAALMREAGYMVTQGWTTPQDIDSAIKATSGVRYAFEGPMALYDIVGWDLIQVGALNTHKSLCNSTEGGNALAAELIAKGHLGLKSGKGAYDYSGFEASQYLNKRSAKIIKMFKAIQELD